MFSKRGSKVGRYKLRWSKYFKFILEGQTFYLKQKAYTNYCDGYKTWELITKETYERNKEKGRKVDTLTLNENIEDMPIEALTLIMNIKYKIDENSMRKAVHLARESVEHIKGHTFLNPSTEFRIFNKILDFYMERNKKDSRKIAI